MSSILFGMMYSKVQVQVQLQMHARVQVTHDMMQHFAKAAKLCTQKHGKVLKSIQFSTQIAAK